MKIGIDLDNVLSTTVKTFVNYHNKMYNTHKKFKECTNSEGNIFDNNKDEFLKRFQNFIKNNSNLLETIEHSKEILKKLSKECDLFVITSRDQRLRDVTVNWLKKNYGDIFKKIILTKYNYIDHKYIKVKSKLEICKENKIKLLIEDSLPIAVSCSKEIPVILLDLKYKWNQSSNLPKQVTRVYSWKEIEKEIRKIL